MMLAARWRGGRWGRASNTFAQISPNSYSKHRTNLQDGDGPLPAAMPSLIDLVRVIPPDREDDPEDIFASAPGLIFTDDLRNIHGDPESIVVYTSKRFGPIELRTADPEGERERRLFSHYVWNASIKLAELISTESDWSVDGETVLELGAGV